jgi:hypothetical protein
MSPTGYTISGGRKNFRTGQRFSPEPNVLDFQSVERVISTDSLGDVSPCSPRANEGIAVSPRAQSPGSPLSPLQWRTHSGDDAEHTANNNDTETPSSGKDSNRVKQFLFHRDRDRARKAQLLYSAAFGSADNSHDTYNSLEQTPRGSPINSTQYSMDGSTGSQRKVGQRRGSNGKGSHTSADRGSGDKYLRIDLETDIRAGTSGLAYSAANTPAKMHSDGKARSPRSAQSAQSRGLPAGYVPSLAVAIKSPSSGTCAVTEDGAASSPYGSNSPYYRALTLGGHGLSPMSVASPPLSAKAVITPGAGSGFNDPSIKVSRSDSTTSTGSDTSSQTGSISSPASPYPEVEYTEDDAVAYETQFPALPLIGRLQLHGTSSSSMLAPKRAAVGSEATAPKEPTVPEIVTPLYTVQEICAMFHSALCGPDEVRAAQSRSDAVRAIRAWDDADSDTDSDDGQGRERSSTCSTASDSSSVDSRAVARVVTLQDQVRKMADIDATCANLMAKCDYIYEILKRPSKRRFDLPWLSGIVQPSVRTTGTHKVGLAAVPSLQDLFITGYVHGGLLYQLVQALQYEDHRFESARLPLLYALYATPPAATVGADKTSDCCLRTKIAAALEHACLERQERCEGLATLATALEMDVNYISKVGYSELCLADSSDCHHAKEVALRSLAAGCDLTALIDGENERPTYKTRDSEGGLVELLKFVVAQEVNAALAQLHVQEGQAHSWSEESKGSAVSTATAAATMNSDALRGQAAAVSAAAFLVSSQTVLLSATAAYTHLFRCYTHKLGACYFAGASENVEQPILLEHLMQCLDGLLAWSKVLCNLRSAQPCTTLPRSASSTACEPTALDVVCERILQHTVRHWTPQVNFAQDIAFMLQSEMVLAIYCPASVGEACSEHAPYHLVYKNYKPGCNVLPPLPLLRNGSRRSVNAASIVLKRLLQRVTSAHTKVATQAIQSLQNPVIMVRYFLPRMATAMVSYIFGTEVGRITFLSGAGE